MIESTIGNGLPGAIAGDSAARLKNRAAFKQPQSFHETLARQVDWNHTGKHQPDEPLSGEINLEQWTRHFTESDRGGEKDLGRTTTKNATPQEENTDRPFCMSANLELVHEPNQAVCFRASVDLNSPKAATKRPEYITHSLATGRLGIAHQSPNAENQTSPFKEKNNPLQRRAGDEKLPETGTSQVTAASPAAMQKPERSEDLAIQPIQQASSTGMFADARTLPPAPFVQNFSGYAVPSSGEMISEAPVFNTYARGETEVLALSLHRCENSRTMRLEIDVPKLGNISARFRSGADGVSVLLSSDDLDNLITVSELQRDMQGWLDQANIEMQDGEKPPGVGVEFTTESDGQKAGRGHENQSTEAGHERFDSIAFADRKSAEIELLVGAEQSEKKWRHI